MSLILRLVWAGGCSSVVECKALSPVLRTLKKGTRFDQILEEHHKNNDVPLSPGGYDPRSSLGLLSCRVLEEAVRTGMRGRDPEGQIRRDKTSLLVPGSQVAGQTPFFPQTSPEDSSLRSVSFTVLHIPASKCRLSEVNTPSAKER